MEFVASIYGPGRDVILFSHNRSYRVAVDHMIVRVYPNWGRVMPQWRVDFCLSLDGASSLDRLNRAYSRGWRAFVPWSLPQKTVVSIPIGEDLEYSTDQLALCFERHGEWPVLKGWLPGEDVDRICDALMDAPRVLHSGHSSPGRQLEAVLDEMRTQQPKAFARYRRSLRHSR